MTARLVLPAIFLCAAGLLQAQNRAAPYAGQSWVGTLVAGSCTSGSLGTKEANRLGLADRVTTPAVDGAGTRGAAAEAPPSSAAGEKKRTAALPKSCRLTGSTSEFALLLDDGTMLRFDALANEKIARQRQGGGKALRVQVAGKLQDGKIALDTIRF